jgi:hypothetical protein
MNPIQRLTVLFSLMLALTGCVMPLPLGIRSAADSTQVLTQPAAPSSAATVWKSSDEAATLASRLTQTFDRSSAGNMAVERLSTLSTTNRTQTECPFVSYQDAVTIVQDAIPTSVDGDADFCGYGGLVEHVFGEGDPLYLGSSYGVAGGTLSDETALSFFQRVATALNLDNRQANKKSYIGLMTMLEAGEMIYVPQGFQEILSGTDEWFVLDYDEDDVWGMIFIKPEADGGPYILFAGRDVEDRMLVVIAHAAEDAYPMLVMEGFYKVIDRLVAGSSQEGTNAGALASSPQNPVCFYLSRADAEAILGGPVQIMATEDQCIYFLADNPALKGAYSIIGLVFTRGEDAIDLLDRIVADIEDEHPNASRALRRRIYTLLEEGDLAAVLNLLPDLGDLADQQGTIQIMARPDAGDNVVGIIYEDRMRGLFGVHANGDLMLVFTEFHEMEIDSDIDAALVAIMQGITAGDGSSAEMPGIAALTQSASTLAESAARTFISTEERLADCYDLQLADVEHILGETVNPKVTVDTSDGYCVHTSVAASKTSWTGDLVSQASLMGHRYLTVSVWPVGSASDPLIYIGFAILDRDHGKFNTFWGRYSGRAALEELAIVKSQSRNLVREFLPDLGDGALWYWQRTSSGEHLAGVYAISGSQRVAVRTLVDATRSQADVQDALIDLVNRLIHEGQ